MKKNLIALSLSIGGALLCATGAQAQSSVQLMGLTDVFVGSMKNAGDAGSSKVVNSGGMTTSWFGVKGTEDLGGGLKANFALTSFIKVDSGTQGRFANDPFFSRDANVGLSGALSAHPCTLLAQFSCVLAQTWGARCGRHGAVLMWLNAAGAAARHSGFHAATQPIFSAR